MEKKTFTTTQFLIATILAIILMSSSITEATFVNITFLESGVPRGAVCLDGSPPAYYYSAGKGMGANNWVIYLEGGGWCGSEAMCMLRAKNEVYGSSYKKDKRIFLGGILSDKPTVNPDFFNWNKVYVGYCDGSSYMSDVQQVDPKNNLKMRGRRIFNAVMEEMMDKGMKNARNVLLSGGSAGGLGAMLHCDTFSEMLSPSTQLKCLSDSGFFISGKFLPKAEDRERRFEKTVEFHKLTPMLPKSCTSKMRPQWQCLFPENFVGDMKTPLFAIESAFDAWKITNDVAPQLPNGKVIPGWEKCINSTKNCDILQMASMRHYGSTQIHTMVQSFGNYEKNGMFIHSCYFHGMMHTDHVWSSSPMVNGKTMGEAVGDWYFERSLEKEIDTKNTQPVETCLRAY